MTGAGRIGMVKGRRPQQQQQRQHLSRSSYLPQARHASSAAYPGHTTGSATGLGRVVGVATASRRPIGGLRGAVTGFALGLGAASAFGMIYVVQQYQSSSEELAVAVHDLQESTARATVAYARISELEERLAKLEGTASTTGEVRQRYGDLVRVYDALHEDVFDVKHKLLDLGACLKERK